MLRNLVRWCQPASATFVDDRIGSHGIVCQARWHRPPQIRGCVRVHVDDGADVLIIGSGLSGIAAALAATEGDRTVVMTEPTDWIGGQLTSQAVPPDEHPWIERTGGSARYREFRRRVRRYYRDFYPLSDSAARQRYLDPGAGWVSPLGHEPRVALAVLESMLQPARASGRLRILTHTAPIQAHVDDDHLRAVTVRAHDDREVTINASVVIDASEDGELYELAGVEHVTGSESRSVTGEPHASGSARPRNMQAATVCVAVDHVGDAHDAIERPASYDRWRAHREPYWPDLQLSWTAINPRTLEPVTYPFDPDPSATLRDRTHLLGRAPGAKDLWSYRRILARDTLRPGVMSGDITILNWPQNDYFGGPLTGVPASEAARHESEARELSRSLLYWLQTEAPRPDGGLGWPGVRARPDVTGTCDGLAKHAYIRESRRIIAETRVAEQDVAQAVRGAHGATPYEDTVGTGYYRLDLHPSTEGDSFLDIPSLPYQVPLGSLLPVRVDGLIAAGKGIGTTHITNGCYRVHPTEWCIGEAAGWLAVSALAQRVPPRAIRSRPVRLSGFQALLMAKGMTLRWPDWVKAPVG